MDFCLFLKIWVKILGKIWAKTWLVNIAKKLLDYSKQSATDAFKTTSKSAIN